MTVYISRTCFRDGFDVGYVLISCSIVPVKVVQLNPARIENSADSKYDIVSDAHTRRQTGTR